MDLLGLLNLLNLGPRRVSPREYHSACPECGGKDRFLSWPAEVRGKCTGAFMCRQCGERGDSIDYT